MGRARGENGHPCTHGAILPPTPIHEVERKRMSAFCHTGPSCPLPLPIKRSKKDKYMIFCILRWLCYEMDRDRRQNGHLNTWPFCPLSLPMKQKTYIFASSNGYTVSWIGIGGKMAKCGRSQRLHSFTGRERGQIMFMHHASIQHLFCSDPM